MSLTLSDVRRIAADVAKQQQPALDVVGVIKREGSCSSAEVIFAIRDCYVAPCRVVIGVSRHASEGECRGAVRMRLGEHLAGLIAGRTRPR